MQFAGAAPVTGEVVDSVTLLVTVPANATTGKISVTNEEGTTSSENNFVVSSEEVAAPVSLDAESVPCFIKLSWQDAATNETGFIIERRTTDATEYSQVATLGANAQSYADASLQDGTEYFYRVRAYSTLGNSPYSEEKSAVAQVAENCGIAPGTGETPAAPLNLVASEPDGEETQIVLNWDATTGATGYNIYRQLSDGSFVLAGTTQETTFTDRGLAFGAEYTYHVRAMSGNQESEPSNTDSATTVDKVTALEDDLAEVSEVFRLYPNPTAQQLKFALKNELYGEVQLRVVNLMGQVQLERTLDKYQTVVEETLDLTGLGTGIYFVEVIQDQYRSVQRLAKQ